MVFGREGVAIAGYVVWQTTRGSEDATPNTQMSSIIEKRRVTMRVFLSSVTIELGVKATTFDEER